MALHLHFDLSVNNAFYQTVRAQEISVPACLQTLVNPCHCTTVLCRSFLQLDWSTLYNDSFYSPPQLVVIAARQLSIDFSRTCFRWRLHRATFVFYVARCLAQTLQAH